MFCFTKSPKPKNVQLILIEDTEMQEIPTLSNLKVLTILQYLKIIITAVCVMASNLPQFFSFMLIDFCFDQKGKAMQSFYSFLPDPHPARCPSWRHSPSSLASHRSSRFSQAQRIPADPPPAPALYVWSVFDSSPECCEPHPPSSGDGRCSLWLWCTGPETGTRHALEHYMTNEKREG